ncbi:D-3-phosphoglycerate dehydrogenase, chloroplastic [Hordeum vulgare]|nr:D-3-phosphoglycerate dehydrogenase, chloroplastic [Hordeum vulgare]KAE8792764.1 D-3-phosphoglycerate dehydrogenase, chloroplastic [Hordeum vulgare]
MEVGRAMEAQLCVPPHHLRVTTHQPKNFLVVFTQPAHHANAVRRGTLRVDDAKLVIQPWCEDDHAGFATFNMHVRCVPEHISMQYWSIEGTQEVFGDKVRVDTRTLEHGHTKTFACGVSVWDMTFNPTRHTYWKPPRGIGRVEEIEVFSLLDRRVAPTPVVPLQRATNPVAPGVTRTRPLQGTKKKKTTMERVDAAAVLPSQHCSVVLTDDIEKFFSNAKNSSDAIESTSINDTLLDAEIEANLASPLEFPTSLRGRKMRPRW